jgi:primosomal protein N''
MPRIATAADIAPAMSAVAQATAEGTITPYDGAELSRILETYAKAIEIGEFERRLKELEQDREDGRAARA